MSLYAIRVGVHPDYTGVWLPATLVSGLGIGLTFPVLGAAAVASLDSTRFAVGSAVNQTSRQIGGALGVAVLVAIVGPTRSPIAALGHFQRLWGFAAGMALLAGAMSLLLSGAQKSHSRTTRVAAAAAQTA